MPTRQKITEAGKRTLLNLAQGHGAWHEINGMSARGGHVSTLQALRAAGLLTRENELTPAGRDAAGQLGATDR